jgi:hypothetical protein
MVASLPAATVATASTVIIMASLVVHPAESVNKIVYVVLAVGEAVGLASVESSRELAWFHA